MSCCLSPFYLETFHVYKYIRWSSFCFTILNLICLFFTSLSYTRTVWRSNCVIRALLYNIHQRKYHYNSWSYVVRNRACTIKRSTVFSSRLKSLTFCVRVARLSLFEFQKHPSPSFLFRARVWYIISSYTSFLPCSKRALIPRSNIDLLSRPTRSKKKRTNAIDVYHSALY